MQNELDAIVSRLQNMPPWDIYQLMPNERFESWYLVDVVAIIKNLVISEDTLAAAVAELSAQIMQWGRFAAQCKRAWEAAEREYRVWREGKYLAYITPPAITPGEDSEAPKWKKPTKDHIDALTRVDPQYTEHYIAQERAEEAFTATTAVLNGFRAKKDLLQIFAIRATENSAPRLTV